MATEHELWMDDQCVNCVADGRQWSEEDGELVSLCKDCPNRNFCPNCGVYMDEDGEQNAVER